MFSYSNRPATNQATEESIYNVNTAANTAQEPKEEPNEDSKDDGKPKEKELTFLDMLNDLNNSQKLVNHLLNNLSDYCAAANAKIKKEPELLQDDCTKMKLVSRKHSHTEEISERLAFLQYYAAESDFQNTKVELMVIYDLLSKSAIKSDLTEFLNWCKKACEA